MVLSLKTATLSRRALLAAAGSSCALGFLPRAASARSGSDPRFVVIILRGALDGLSAVAPVGDPDYAALHGAIALPPAGEHAALPLDGFFGLHPSMPVFARLYKENRASVIHAVATSYRERSHFEGQDVLESGYPGPGHTESGSAQSRDLGLACGGNLASAWSWRRCHGAACHTWPGTGAWLGAANSACRERRSRHARS